MGIIGLQNTFCQQRTERRRVSPCPSEQSLCSGTTRIYFRSARSAQRAVRKCRGFKGWRQRPPLRSCGLRNNSASTKARSIHQKRILQNNQQRSIRVPQRSASQAANLAQMKIDTDCVILWYDREQHEIRDAPKFDSYLLGHRSLFCLSRNHLCSLGLLDC